MTPPRDDRKAEILRQMAVVFQVLKQLEVRGLVGGGLCLSTKGLIELGDEADALAVTTTRDQLCEWTYQTWRAAARALPDSPTSPDAELRRQAGLVADLASRLGLIGGG